MDELDREVMDAIADRYTAEAIEALEAALGRYDSAFETEMEFEGCTLYLARDGRVASLSRVLDADGVDLDIAGFAASEGLSVGDFAAREWARFIDRQVARDEARACREGL